MFRLIKLALKGLSTLVLLLVILVFALWLRAFKPADIETVAVDCRGTPPVYDGVAPLKVLSYNVQYMASKNYVFFYDIDQNDPARVAAVAAAGKTLADRPKLSDIKWTIEEVAQIIEREAPDVVLLQEINTGEDSRTHYYDQIDALRARLGDNAFPCEAHTSYWQAEYILHPSILGPVDMRLLTLSRYRMTDARRFQLPRPAINAIERPFYFQRALLETRLAGPGEREFAMINTHFEAWGGGTGVMQRQVGYTLDRLEALDAEGVPWILGGDLNLLPPDEGRQRTRIEKAKTGLYDEEPPIGPLYARFGAIPALSDLLADDPSDWFTHIPNDPTVEVPDRTIDYVFYSDRWMLDDAGVIHGAAWQVSDHLPVFGKFRPREPGAAAP